MLTLNPDATYRLLMWQLERVPDTTIFKPMLKNIGVLFPGGSPEGDYGRCFVHNQFGAPMPTRVHSRKPPCPMSVPLLLVPWLDSYFTETVLVCEKNGRTWVTDWDLVKRGEPDAYPPFEPQLFLPEDLWSELGREDEKPTWGPFGASPEMVHVVNSKMPEVDTLKEDA